jgi:hypothetical protein
VDEESAKVQQLTNDEIKDLHRASIGVLKEGENLTIDQVLRRAVNKMGKTPWSLAALAAVTTNAYANAPADEKKLETLMRALQHYDNLGPGRGREMWAEGLKNVGLEGVGKYVDDSFKSGLNRVANIGKEKDSGYGKADEAVLNFVYESGKDIVAEPFGWIDSAGKWLNNWSEDSRTSSGVMQSPMQAQINASTQNNLDQQPLFNETFGVLQADQNRPIENLHSATNSPKVNAYIRQQRREDMAPYAGLLEDRFFTRPR